MYVCVENLRLMIVHEQTQPQQKEMDTAFQLVQFAKRNALYERS